jgi:hypothetical protein
MTNIFDLLNIPNATINTQTSDALIIKIGLVNVKAIFASNDFSVALYNNGSGIAWGKEYGLINSFNTYCQNNNDIKNIALGFNFIIILKTNNRARVFGDNNDLNIINIKNIESVENIDRIFAGGLNAGYTILT